MEQGKVEPVVNYFPGHMSKALGRIKETVRVADAALLVLDSRAPLASFPAGLEKILGEKPRILLLSKRDLADPKRTKDFMALFQNKGYQAFDADLTDPKETRLLKARLDGIRTSRDNRFLRLKLPLPPVKCLVLGIPNVGKSTAINALGGRNRAVAENVPGKTRKTTLFRATGRLWLFDTPGILEPDVHDRQSMVELALLGSVKDDVLPHDYLGEKLLDFLRRSYPDAFAKRYGIPLPPSDGQAYLDLAKKRRFLTGEGKPDVERALRCLLGEFKDGALGGITLDEAKP